MEIIFPIVVVVLIFSAVSIITLNFQPESNGANEFRESRGKPTETIRSQHNNFKDKDTQEKEKKKKINSLKPILNVVQQAKVSKIAVAHFPVQDLLEVINFIQEREAVFSAVEVFNQEIRSKYMVLVKPILDEKKIDDEDLYSAQMDLDVSKCMELGRNSILRLPEVSACIPDAKEAMGPSKKISKTHSWEDLKGDF